MMTKKEPSDDEEQLPSDDECDMEDEDSAEPSYCPCGGDNTSDIWCDGDDQCSHKWLHFKCVGLSAKTIPPGKWFCDGN